MKVVWIAGFLLASALSGCSDDCRKKCETEEACGVQTASLEDCTRACQILAEKLSSADRTGSCVSCYDDKCGESCSEEECRSPDGGLFPIDPAVAGDCDDECGR